MYGFYLFACQLYEAGCHVKKELEAKHATYKEALKELKGLHDEVHQIIKGQDEILIGNKNLVAKRDELCHEVVAMKCKISKATREHLTCTKRLTIGREVILRCKGP